MQIDFYCEFPKQGLQKLKLLKHKCRVFIAAHSIKEFKKLEKQFKEINKKVKCCYWPIIPNSYWVSPFSNSKDLLNTFNELSKINNQILIDLELPMLNKKLLIKNLSQFSKNKKLIKEFLQKNKNKITTAQFPSKKFAKIMKSLGLNYKIKTEKSLMWYSSMAFNNKKIKQYLKKANKKYIIGLGTIAIGIKGNEPILSPKNLKSDIKFIKNLGYKKVIIFRLGGLNKDYVNTLSKFQNAN